MEGGAELYGEIEFDSLAIALEAIRARHGGLGAAARTETFVDVGSGSGLPVVGAARGCAAGTGRPAEGVVAVVWVVVVM